MTAPTYREELAAIKTDVKWIREQLAENFKLEKRVSRLEQMGAAGSALLTAFCIWLKIAMGR